MTLSSFLLALALTTVQVDVISLPLDKSVNVVLMPAGKAELKRERTVTRVKVELDALRAPSTLGPVLNTYLVWAVSPEGFMENMGEVNVKGSKGEFDGTTRLGQIGILITAEPHYMVDVPSAAVAYRSTGPRDTVRHLPVSIDVGRMDYSGLTPISRLGVPSFVTQARMAVQIAQTAGAARLAEPELRRARAAMDTMQQLLSRAAPDDIVWTSAAEATRWSQRALAVVKEKEALDPLKDAQSALELADQEKEQSEARAREAERGLSDAENQIRSLRAELARVSGEKDELSGQSDQAEARARAAEQNLAALKREQERLQDRLRFTWQPEYFDEMGLTEAGREAVLRVCNFAEVIPGPIRIQGTAPEAAVKAAMELMLLAGVPQDRIATRR